MLLRNAHFYVTRGRFSRSRSSSSSLSVTPLTRNRMLSPPQSLCKLFLMRLLHEYIRGKVLHPRQPLLACSQRAFGERYISLWNFIRNKCLQEFLGKHFDRRIPDSEARRASLSILIFHDAKPGEPRSADRGGLGRKRKAGRYSRYLFL